MRRSVACGLPNGPAALAPKLRRIVDMRVVATEKAQQNAATADPWTIVHFAAGLALGLMDAPFRSSVAAAIAYEGAEQIFERQDWGKTFFRTSGPEILSNAVLDVVIFVAGHRMGTWWNSTGGRGS